MTPERHKRGRITLERLFPVSQYMGALFLALSYPRLPNPLVIAPGLVTHRALILLWVPVLLLFAFLMDRAWLNAYRRDLAEIKAQAKNANLNRSTLLALGVPCLFLADFAAIAHLYVCLYQTGMAMRSGTAVQTLIMAAGMVLWIYGRRLPHIPFASLWGIRTARTLQSQQAWATVHLAAVRWFCGAGAVFLIIGAFL